jgi:hypothetical protein
MRRALAVVLPHSLWLPADRRHSPARFTSWEIHPVYNIEVCKFKSASGSPLNSTIAWVAFDDWLGEDKNEDDK